MSAQWEAVKIAHHVHVLPLDDLITHDSDTCACGPTTEPIKRDDGGIGWVITHHSLDGRELHEWDAP